jgi:hypothetical protein
VATICGVWIVAALFAVPSALSKFWCDEFVVSGSETYYKLVFIFELSISCVLPVCVIAFTYIMTSRHLVKILVLYVKGHKILNWKVAEVL